MAPANSNEKAAGNNEFLQRIVVASAVYICAQDREEGRGREEIGPGSSECSYKGTPNWSYLS